MGGYTVKVRELMSKPVIRIHADEPVSVAARTLTHYNIGVLPVCTAEGKLCGMLTDRDIVTRCLAAERLPGNTRVREIMTGNVVAAAPDMDTGAAAALMGKAQVRRLPVLEGGKLCGMVTLGDLSQKEESVYDATDALAEITGNVSVR